ncbi:hypothetical protein ACUODJ_13830, partial [Escherichia sp. HC-CC]
LSEMGYTHVENAGGLKDIAMPKVKGVTEKKRRISAAHGEFF